MKPFSKKTGVIRQVWNGVTGNQKRWYSTKNTKIRYRYAKVAMLSRWNREINSIDDVEFYLKNQFDALEALDFFEPESDEDCLSVVLTPEFAWNFVPAVFPTVVTYDEQMPEPTWGAHGPMSQKLYEIMRAGWAKRLSALPPGFIAVVGGTAVDTGVVLKNGKIRGLNLGFIAESGKDADAIMFSKFHHDTIDSWNLLKYEPDVADDHVGPLIREVEDPTGKSAILSAFICADMEKGPFPLDMETSHLIFCSSLGTPPNWQKEWLENGRVGKYSSVAVNESSRGTGTITGPHGAFTVDDVPKHPWLKGLHGLADRAGLGDVVLYGYEYLLGLPKNESIGNKLGFVKVKSVTHDKDGQTIVITEKMPLPGAFDDSHRFTEVDDETEGQGKEKSDKDGDKGDK